jgi:DNA-binding protein H-NS
MLRKGRKPMAKNDFGGMTLKQMIDMQDRLAAAIEEKRKEDREETKRAVEEFAEKRGFSVTDLFGATGRKKGGKVAVKYINPENRSETWTGRGRTPRWLAEKLKKGAKIDQFEI